MMLQKELKKLQESMPIKQTENHDNYIEFVSVIFGPNDETSPFYKKLFEVTVQLTNSFPQKSPSICLTKNAVWHPNIAFESGSVCMNLRGNDWDSRTQLADLLVHAIPALLHDPNPNDPHNLEAAKEYKTNQTTWKLKALSYINKKQITPNQLQQYHFANFPHQFLEQCQLHNFQVIMKISPIIDNNLAVQRNKPKNIIQQQSRKRFMVSGEIRRGGQVFNTQNETNDFNQQLVEEIQINNNFRVDQNYIPDLQQYEQMDELNLDTDNAIVHDLQHQINIQRDIQQQDVQHIINDDQQNYYQHQTSESDSDQSDDIYYHQQMLPQQLQHQIIYQYNNQQQPDDIFQQQNFNIIGDQYDIQLNEQQAIHDQAHNIIEVRDDYDCVVTKILNKEADQQYIENNVDNNYQAQMEQQLLDKLKINQIPDISKLQKLYTELREIDKQYAINILSNNVVVLTYFMNHRIYDFADQLKCIV